MVNYSSVFLRYPDLNIDVLNNFNLKVCSGEKVALIGDNGSGKTTLLYATAGLLPFKGTIEIDGKTMGAETAKEIRKGIGFLFSIPEDQILFPTVLQDVKFALLQKGESSIKAQEMALHYLDMMGMLKFADSSPHKLSHGQKQRVALASIVAANPSLMLLDEPSAALDPKGRDSLSVILQREKSTMIIATHDIEFAKKTCNRFITIENGSALMDKNHL
jgi:cobalt/nickel transport system ATP-binding protein